VEQDRYYTEVSGQLHVPAAYHGEENLGNHCNRSWVDARACLDAEVKERIYFYQESNPDSPDYWAFGLRTSSGTLKNSAFPFWGDSTAAYIVMHPSARPHLSHGQRNDIHICTRDHVPWKEDNRKIFKKKKMWKCIRRPKTKTKMEVDNKCIKPNQQ
jgi:hypothetical protein